MGTPTDADASGAPEHWLHEIDSWRTSMRSAHLSEQTIGLRTYHLRRVGTALSTTASPWDVTPAALLEWTGNQEWSRETARSVYTSLRRFWSWGAATERTRVNAAAELPRVAPTPGRPRPASPATVARAIAQSDARLVLIIRLANELGMRRGEVAQVHPENDVVADLVGWALIVHGKGARKRVLPLPDDLADVLRAAPPGYLFPGKGGRGHLSPHWVGTLVSRALGDGTSMHQLRHLCATEVHDETHDIRLVQTLLGHASLATTQRYVAVNDAKVREAVAARSLRWRHPSD